jgi:hypothetical protein
LIPNAFDLLGQAVEALRIERRSVVFNSPQSPLLCCKITTKLEFAEAACISVEFLSYRFLNGLSDHHEKLLAKLIGDKDLNRH